MSEGEVAWHTNLQLQPCSKPHRGVHHAGPWHKAFPTRKCLGRSPSQSNTVLSTQHRCSDNASTFSKSTIPSTFAKMSGAEVSLAIVPLLISAAEHWHSCVKPFKRFRKFSTEVDCFQERLKVQHTIFRNQCRILLENVIQDDDAPKQMLTEPGHPSWADPELERHLNCHLAESKDACLTIIRLMCERLQNVNQESHDLGEIVAQDKQVQEPSTTALSLI